MKVQVQGDGTSETRKVNPEFWKMVLAYQLGMLKTWVEACTKPRIDSKGKKRAGTIILPIAKN